MNNIIITIIIVVVIVVVVVVVVINLHTSPDFYTPVTCQRAVQSDIGSKTCTSRKMPLGNPQGKE